MKANTVMMPRDRTPRHRSVVVVTLFIFGVCVCVSARHTEDFAERKRKSPGVCVCTLWPTFSFPQPLVALLIINFFVSLGAQECVLLAPQSILSSF